MSEVREGPIQKFVQKAKNWWPRRNTPTSLELPRITSSNATSETVAAIVPPAVSEVQVAPEAKVETLTSKKNLEEIIDKEKAQVPKKHRVKGGSFNGVSFEDLNRQEREAFKREFRPFNPEIFRDELDFIRIQTQYERETGPDSTLYGDDFAREMKGHYGINEGDYQRWFGHGLRKTHSRTNEDEGIAVDLNEEIKKYVDRLLALGIPQVNIVDFAAGGAKTLVTAARSMEALVREGKVTLTATNLYSEPTPESVSELKENYQYRELVEAIEKKLIRFVKADITELYEMMKGRPVHLFFMLNSFDYTQAYNDVLLNMVGKMLDAEYGTAVLGYPEAAHERTDRGYGGDLTRKGIWALELNKFQEAQGRREGVDSILVYQASKSPLFRISEP